MHRFSNVVNGLKGEDGKASRPLQDMMESDEEDAKFPEDKKQRLVQPHKKLFSESERHGPRVSIDIFLASLLLQQ
jgi:hypothetical protein